MTLDLYWVTPESITDADLLRRYHALLAPEEVAQHARYAFAHDKHTYLVARALVRSVLSRHAPEVAPHAWSFEKNRWGRPFVAATHGAVAESLRFNLSHTKGGVVLLVGEGGRDLGVDVESVARPGRTIEVADRFFSRAEANALRALPVEDQRHRFFELWTLKEAYIKARGMGLAIPLSHFSFVLEGADAPGIAFDPRLVDDAARWRFAIVRPGPTHMVSLAAASLPPGDPPGRLAFRCWQTRPLSDDPAPLVVERLR